MLQFYNHLLDLMSDFLFINDTCLANASDTQLIELYDKLNQTPSLYFHLFIIAPFPLAIIGFITNFLFIYQVLFSNITVITVPLRLGMVYARVYCRNDSIYFWSIEQSVMVLHRSPAFSYAFMDLSAVIYICVTVDVWFYL